jgi:ribosomal protein L34
MHLKIRKSSLKKRRKNGFRRKMRTKSGRAIVNRQRARSIGKKKYNAKKARLIKAQKANNA